MHETELFALERIQFEHRARHSGIRAPDGCDGVRTQSIDIGGGGVCEGEKGHVTRRRYT